VLKLPVLLDSPGAGGVRCASRDIGMGGMFLEAAASNFSKGEEVNVLISLPSEEGGVGHSLTARVTRIAKDGVGIAFFNPDTATFRTLQELLKYSKSQNLH
jgi:hypothetical protein